MTEEKTRILLVEDNPADRDLITALAEEVQGFAFSIEAVNRLAEGIERLPGVYDLVLLDLSLPDASGLEGLDRLRSAAPDVPVIVLTGLDDDALAVSAVNAGAQDYLVKGREDGRAVVRSIRYALERHEFIAQLHQYLEREREVSERLRESERRFRSLVANLPGAVYRRSATAPWVCDFMSNAVCAITGYEMDAFGRARPHWDEIIHPEDAPSFTTGFLESIERQAPYRIEYRIVRADRALRWVLDRGMPVSVDGVVRFVEGVVFDITPEKRAEQVMDQLRILEDRERIARDLHDGVVQSMFALGGKLLASAEQAASDALGTQLREAVDVVNEIMRDLRRYIFALRPSLVGGIGLERDLRSVAKAFHTDETAVTVEIQPVAASATADWGADEHLVQAAREALSNAVRHSGARHVRLALTFEDGLIVLEVSDDGRGFSTGAYGRGQGLANLEARAVSLGGELRVESSPGSGTRVRLMTPLEGPILEHRHDA